MEFEIFVATIQAERERASRWRHGWEDKPLRTPRHTPGWLRWFKAPRRFAGTADDLGPQGAA